MTEMVEERPAPSDSEKKEFNPAEEVIADLSQQVAVQAREIAFLRTAVKQRDLMLQEKESADPVAAPRRKTK